MSNSLHYITINGFTAQNGRHHPSITLSYQVFGQPLDYHPIIWVGHALTGNSDVAHPETGWWKNLIGPQKTIDTKRYSVICFNAVGNGYDGTKLKKHDQFTAGDQAELQFLALKRLRVNQLFAAIGGSIGGGILWELAIAHPSFIQTIIPIACSWQSSSWVKAFAHVQHHILCNSDLPLQDARKMAMLLYRTPQSFDIKFNNQVSDSLKNSAINWLEFHGNSLANRFSVEAYKSMNYIMSTIQPFKNASHFEEQLKKLQSHVVQVAITSDILFHPQTNKESKNHLDSLHISNEHHEIISAHGHDAFLIEFEQLSRILSPHFNN